MLKLLFFAVTALLSPLTSFADLQIANPRLCLELFVPKVSINLPNDEIRLIEYAISEIKPYCADGYCHSNIGLLVEKLSALTETKVLVVYPLNPAHRLYPQSTSNPEHLTIGWKYHVVALYKEYIIDLDYKDSQKIINANTYFSTMFGKGNIGFDTIGIKIQSAHSYLDEMSVIGYTIGAVYSFERPTVTLDKLAGPFGFVQNSAMIKTDKFHPPDKGQMELFDRLSKIKIGQKISLSYVFYSSPDEHENRSTHGIIVSLDAWKVVLEQKTYFGAKVHRTIPLQHIFSATINEI